MDAIWEFLKDPTNQATLGWVGAAVVAIGGALWAALRTVTRHSKKKDTAAARKVSAESGGIAIGGNVTDSNVSTSRDQT